MMLRNLFDIDNFELIVYSRIIYSAFVVIYPKRIILFNLFNYGV